MKIKLLIAAFTLGIAIAGSTAANAGTRQNYAHLIIRHRQHYALLRRIIIPMVPT